MKDKIVRMTSDEINRNYDVEKALCMAEKAPEFSLEDIIKEEGIQPGPVVARGFAAFKDYINRQGRPKAQDPKVSISIRIPLSRAVKLRETGPGWQTRTSDFIVSGIDRGELVPGNAR